MLSFSRLLGQLLVLAGLLLSTAEQAVAQAQVLKPGAPVKKPTTLDSSKVYTFVEHMPVYPNGDMQAFMADFQREFLHAIAARCSPPSQVFVNFTVGPSGTIYDVKSKSANQNLPKLSAACEAALFAAASKLSRFTPGTQNRRPVAVNFTLKLGVETR